MTATAIELTEITGLALIIALSPVPVTGQLLLVLNNRSPLTPGAFAIGWAAAVALLAALVATGAAVLLPPLDVDWADIALVPLVVGLGMIAGGVVVWTRTAPDTVPEPSRLTAMFTRLSPVRALLLGLGYGAFRPKNFVAALAAGLIIGAENTDVWEGSLLVVYFAVLGSVTLAAPVLVYALGGTRTRAAMRRLQGTLSRHGRRITSSALVVIGLLLAGFGGYQLLS